MYFDYLCTSSLGSNIPNLYREYGRSLGGKHSTSSFTFFAN